MSDMQTILITGTSRGLGQGLAAYFCERGIRVIGCSRSGVDFEYAHYQHFITDLSDPAAIRAMFADIRKQDITIDVLVLNAGWKKDALFLQTPSADLEQSLTHNTSGAFAVTREAAKMMMLSGGGRIINISSVAVSMALAGTGTYVAGKAATEAMLKVIGAELAQAGITVNTVAISYLEGTGMVNDMTEAAIEKLKSQLPSSAAPTISDVAHCIEFFASDRAAGITNQTVRFGGVS